MVLADADIRIALRGRHVARVTDAWRAFQGGMTRSENKCGDFWAQQVRCSPIEGKADRREAKYPRKNQFRRVLNPVCLGKFLH